MKINKKELTVNYLVLLQCVDQLSQQAGRDGRTETQCSQDRRQHFVERLEHDGAADSQLWLRVDRRKDDWSVSEEFVAVEVRFLKQDGEENYSMQILETDLWNFS